MYKSAITNIQYFVNFREGNEMNFLVFCGFLFLDFVFISINGFLFSVFWGWFLVPVFSLPVLSIAQAVGVMLVAGMVTRQRIPDYDEDLYVLAKKVFSHKIAQLVSWIAIGVILHYFFF